MPVDRSQLLSSLSRGEGGYKVILETFTFLFLVEEHESKVRGASVILHFTIFFQRMNYLMKRKKNTRVPGSDTANNNQAT